nr:MAG TPA: hypothetical protein [Caudoviricetes sp.]
MIISNSLYDFNILVLIYTFLIFRTTAKCIVLENANKNQNNQVHNQNL